MPLATLQRLKWFLRSPTLIVVEITVITLAGVAGILVSPGAASERVFRSGWFMGTVFLAFISLLIVAFDQVRQLYRSRSLQVARGGVLLVHVGLLLVILAAGLKTLFGGEAMVDMLEGETLPPTAKAWVVQKPGRWVAPLQVAEPVTLEAVDARRYPAGDLQGIAVRLRLAGATPRVVDLPINQGVEVSGTRLFVGSDYGPAALVEWRGATGGLTRTAALLKHERGQRFETTLAGPDGEHVYLRAEVGPSGRRPAAAEVRIMKGPALLFAGVLPSGQRIRLSSGSVLALHGLPFWIRLHASRDPTLGLIYLGFACVILGVTLRFILSPLPRSPAAVAGAPAGNQHAPAMALQPALVLALAGLLVLTACSGYSRPKARELVERYNTVVAEAYRRGDVKLVDAVAGPNEAKKLTGLIGVRLDMGLTLDSRMVSLDVLEAELSNNELRVRTREQWSYCDRRIGTGEQVGARSDDAYEMRYFFKRFEQAWLVDRIEFAAPPRFGRPPGTWAVEHGRAPGHGGGRTDRRDTPHDELIRW